jgi:hypothetical protein
MNLYLYIPPLSAHPQSSLKGLLYGELGRYWIQNNPSKFQEILCKFIQRLINRGHTLEQLTPILTHAAVTLDNKVFNPTALQLPIEILCISIGNTIQGVYNEQTSGESMKLHSSHMFPTRKCKSQSLDPKIYETSLPAQRSTTLKKSPSKASQKPLIAIRQTDKS